MAKIIAIGGGSGAGKTFLAKAIENHLGEKIVTLPFDSYYLDQSSHPLSERAKVNYDHPSSLDAELFFHHLSLLKEGKAVEIPIYDFSTHTRKEETIHLEPSDIIIVEGILVYEMAAKSLYDYKIYVDCAPDVRLARRIRRDILERGRSAESVISQYLSTVRPSHLQFVEPHKKVCDFIYENSTNDGLDDVQFSKLIGEISKL
ncbi:MAG: uridine kinase [Bacilli bacterium]|nr:uridine kinase [Bacilli bacterium]